MIFLNGNTELIWSVSFSSTCEFEQAYLLGFFFILWKEKELLSLHETGLNGTNTFPDGLVVSPSSHRAPHLPMSYPTLRRTFIPSEAALILPGHKGAVELLVHCTRWQERVLMLVPKVLSFLWYLWICMQCVLSNLPVQTRQLVLAARCVFCSLSLLPLDKSFLSKLNL